MPFNLPDPVDFDNIWWDEVGRHRSELNVKVLKVRMSLD